jgi:hypothetical protein
MTDASAPQMVLSDKIDDEFKYFTTAEPTSTPQDQLYD